MADAFLCFGGGSDLDFDVVSSTTQPAGTDKLIWVNSTTQVASWYITSAVPASAGAAGDVAIVATLQPIGAVAPVFNVLDDNGIYLRPVSAYQYIGSAWVKKEAKVYLNGAWQQLSLMIINGADTSVSGGWTAYGGSGTTTGYSAVLSTDGLTINGAGGGARGTCYMNAFEPESLANFNTMVIEYTLANLYSGADVNALHVSSIASPTKDNILTYSLASVIVPASATKNTLTLDISSISAGYPCFCLGQLSGFVISSLRLE